MPIIKYAGRTLFHLALITLCAAPAFAGEMTASWKNGLKLSDDDGNSVKIGGRLFVDWAWFSTDDDFDASADEIPVDGTEIRQARIFLSGTMHEAVSYKFQVDFASGSASFKDAYIALDDSPLGGANLTIGQFRHPVGLEENTSSKYITFMERSQLSGFTVGRQSGIGADRSFLDDRLLARASLFRVSNSQGEGSGADDYGVAARLSGLPWRTDEGSLLHLGASFARRNRVGRGLFVNEPEAHLHPGFSSVDPAADAAATWGAEAAAVFGPFSLQGEYMLLGTTAPEGAEDAGFSTWYGQASWFVTGESRQYGAGAGAFSRVSPRSPYGSRGYGALELAARFSSTDLNDDPWEGGTLDTITLGANWYLNPNTRMMVNWVRADGESPAVTGEQSATGVTSTIQTRLQVDF